MAVAPSMVVNRGQFGLGGPVRDPLAEMAERQRAADQARTNAGTAAQNQFVSQQQQQFPGQIGGGGGAGGGGASGAITNPAGGSAGPDFFAQQKFLAEQRQREFNDRLAAFREFIPQSQPRETRATSGGPQEEQARAVAFARAKEQAGNTAKASLKSLQDVTAGSGLTGSTREAAAGGEIIGRAGAGVNEFTRQQLESDLARAREISDQEFAANIQQRGQDLQRLPSLTSLLSQLF